MQLDKPGALENVPAAHDKHVVWFVLDWNLPTEHEKHDVTAVAENLPAAHGVCTAPEGHAEPA